MISLLRDVWRQLPGILAALLIGATALLLLAFPRTLADLANWVGSSDTFVVVLLRWFAALAINAGLIWFFIVKPLTHLRKARRTSGLVVRRGQGVAFLDTESARQQVFSAVSKVTDVQKVEVTVLNDLGRAEVTVNVLTHHDINGIKKKGEIRREIKKTLEDQLGLGLAQEPVINLRLSQTGPEVPYAASPDLMQIAPGRVNTPATEPKPSPKEDDPLILIDTSHEAPTVMLSRTDRLDEKKVVDKN